MVSFKSLFLYTAASSATLLAHTKDGDSITTLGSCQFEGQNHGDSVQCDKNTGDNLPAHNSSIYIHPKSKDPSGKDCIHYHRDAHFRRAEIHAAGKYAANSNYYAGFTFMLPHAQKSLMLFQFKKADGTSKPVQNIPFGVEFDQHDQLAVRYTPPGGELRWLFHTEPVAMNKTHSVAFAWDTYDGTKDSNGKRDTGGTSNGSLTMYFDGKKVNSTSGLNFWSGNAYPKFGIYRGEDDGSYSDGNPAANVFDYYLYSAAVSDKGLGEIAEYAGLTN